MDNKIIYIKPYTNWLTPEQAYNYFSVFGTKYKNIQLTNDPKQANYFFVINYPLVPLPYPSRTIVFHMEPSVALKHWGDYWSNPPRADFLQVRDHQRYLNNLEWHLPISRDKFSAILDKTNEEYKIYPISTVISNKAFDAGHIKRINFLRFIEARQGLQVDIYGKCASLGFKNYRGELPYMDKGLALWPYMYHLAVENNAERNYITEKVVDGIMAGCLVFYHGAPNIHEIFGAAVISLQLGDFEHDYNLIMRAIEDKEREKRLPAIRRAQELILNQYSIYPTLYHTLTSFSKRRQTYCLNLDRRTDRREKMVTKLAAAGIDHYKWWRAIDGRSHTFSSAEIALFSGNDFGSKRGVMACALGHYNMWRELVADEKAAQDDYYFILEDDVEFRADFPQFFDYLVTRVYEQDPHWDMFFPSFLYDENLSDLYNKKKWHY